ncbi:MAG: hypothetical protein ACK528_07720 [Alphaproteobacteria bacterium]
MGKLPTPLRATLLERLATQGEAIWETLNKSLAARASSNSGGLRR